MDSLTEAYSVTIPTHCAEYLVTRQYDDNVDTA